MIRKTSQGWALFLVMTVIFIIFLFLSIYSEQKGNPILSKLGINQKASMQQCGGNMEGKEARFGITNSVIWSVATTAASNGSVNSMHDSYTPIGGLVSMLMIQFGEVIYGGVGSGLYGMIIFVLLAVFMAGLMVGRTPEYLGKKIEVFEMKMAALIILISPTIILLGTAISVIIKPGISGIFNPGAHGFSEVLYAFSSVGNNNGSAFAGLNTNSIFYNTILGCCMFIGRWWSMLLILAIAGSLAKKKYVPESSGTLATNTPLFIAFLIGIVIIVGALTYVPALALGPLVEYIYS